MDRTATAHRSIVLATVCREEETRREHLLELRAYLGMEPFGLAHYRQAVHAATELALQTDKGIMLANSVLDDLRHRHVILPTLDVVERVCAEAITRANRQIYETLSEPLSDAHRRRLDDLLKRRDNGKTTWLAWLRQSPVKPNSRHMLEHIERLKAWQALDLPSGVERSVHQNRLLKIAREGGQMTPADLAKFEAQRRYATLVALAIEGMATVTDEIIDLHDRILGKLFNAAKNKHQQQFQASGKAINAKVRLFGRIGQALIEAKQAGRDPFAAIEGVLSWDAFAENVTEAQKLAQPEDFDFLHRIGESYATLRRYAPEFLAVLAAGCARCQGCAGRHRGAARHEQRQRTQGACRCADRLHQAALAEAGDDRCRHRPALLRVVRTVGTEERAALRRHLGARLTPVQGFRGLPGTACEIRQPQAGQRTAAGCGHQLRPVPA
jgi:hypothetical protein